MKKQFTGPILTVIALILIAGLFVYFYIQLNRTEKKMLETQAAISQDAGKISAIVNFLNANLNAQNNK